VLKKKNVGNGGAVRDLGGRTIQRAVQNAKKEIKPKILSLVSSASDFPRAERFFNVHPPWQLHFAPPSDFLAKAWSKAGSTRKIPEEFQTPDMR
jgi:hypothetical protein